MSAVLERTTTPVEADPAPVALSRLRGFQTGARELDDTACAVHGKLPVWLQGHLLLNGPAVWDLPHGHYAHWFDGLAMLHRLRFADGQVLYRSRFADSQSYRLARAAGKPWWANSPRRTPSPGCRASRISSTPAAATTRRW